MAKSPANQARSRPLNVIVDPASEAELIYYARGTVPEVRAPGVKASPAHDLTYHGGKIIPDLTFTNFYVGGQAAWNAGDITNIDQALSAAMSDQHLNNVMQQYFAGPITTKFRPSTVLAGPPPATVSQGDIEQTVKSLYDNGSLARYDLATTVGVFLLPRGTILTDDPTPTGGAAEPRRMPTKDSTSRTRMTREPKFDEAVDSLHGLGGYHGSIHPAAGITVYYAVGVYSETQPDETTNGIPVFDQPWKNVVATFYHELNEARTDADVEDANRPNAKNPMQFIGWLSRKGEECGDFPVFEARPLTRVFQEVPLTNGSGTVPIQFMYSDAVHGPEGPISAPHPSILPVAVPV
jgi:hypothetical protein